ncbi:MAG: hypothetical protein QNJ44_22055 [Rhodobacter sp.]|nr:hypothetical protein [Rhodobacter sp.]
MWAGLKRTVLAAALALAAAPGAADILKDGDDVIFWCAGTEHGPRWLDADARDGRVFLTDQTSTFWRAIHVGPGDTYAFEFVSPIDNPDRKYLDCLTETGGVQLAPAYGAPYTGALWQIELDSPSRYALKCLGHIEGNRYLDGNTIDGTVGLAPYPGGPYSGAIWAIR